MDDVAFAVLRSHVAILRRGGGTLRAAYTGRGVDAPYSSHSTARGRSTHQARWQRVEAMPSRTADFECFLSIMRCMMPSHRDAIPSLRDRSEAHLRDKPANCAASAWTESVFRRSRCSGYDSGHIAKMSRQAEMGQLQKFDARPGYASHVSTPNFRVHILKLCASNQ